MNEKRKMESLLSMDGNFIITFKFIKKIKNVKAMRVCVCICGETFQCFRLKEIPFSLSTLEVYAVLLK